MGIMQSRPPCYTSLNAVVWYQESSESKLFDIVLTHLFDGHTVVAHNKQGGCGRHILPD